MGGTVGTCYAREATSEEVDRYWPRLVGSPTIQTTLCAGHAVAGPRTNGGVALEVLLENPPDVVLLDAMLPGLDGLEIAAECAGKSPTRGSGGCRR